MESRKWLSTKALLILAIVIVCHNKTDAKLNVIPRDTEVKINDRTYMNCSTSMKADLIQWRHGRNYVYTALGFLEPYNDGRFSVEINAATGANNIVIRSIKPSDAGHYECWEDEGSGETRAAQLIVLDNDPICESNMHSDGVIGPNSCGIEPVEVNLSCSVTYHGNIPPILQWKTRNWNLSSTEGLVSVTVSHHRVNYALTMKSALALSNSSFICQTTRTTDNPYNCTSDVINILYVFDSKVTINMTMNDEISCFANSSQSCSYKWKWFNGDDISTESANWILKPKRVGMHRCEATCSLVNRSCRVESMNAMVYSDSWYSTAETRIALLALLLVGLLVLIVIGVSVYCWRKRRMEKQKRDKFDREREQEQRLIGPMTRYTEKPKLVKKLNFGGLCSIWGLAMLNKELFIVSAYVKGILVYDPVAHQNLRTIEVEGANELRDIAACKKKNCLFVVGFCSGQSLFCIDKYGRILKKWEVPIEPHNLSVSPAGNILLTYDAKIMIYKSHGKVMHSLELDEDKLSMSWHTILRRDTNDYLVCQGWEESKHHRVLILSPEGNVLRSFGSEKKRNSNKHLSDPVYMDIDRNGIIFVADSSNNRVVLLNKELDFLKELLTEEDGIIKPYRVLLDEASKRLYVGTNKGDLLIFNVFE